MSERLQKLRQRILMPIGLTALFTASVGRGWLHSDALFTAGFLVVLVTFAALVAVVELEKHAEQRENESERVA